MTVLAGERDRPDYSEYTIRLASREQEQEHWRAQFVPWNAGKSWEQFTPELEHLRDTLAPHRVFRLWVLVRRDDYDGRIYSGCETYRRQALIRTQGSKKIIPSWMYGIASVVTPTDQLRKGFANHMLKLLHYALGDSSALPSFPPAWGAPPTLSPLEREDVPSGIASILYSDVGSTFYERCTIGQSLPGWVAEPSDNQEIVWRIQARSAEAKDRNWDWLYLKDLEDLGKVPQEVYNSSKRFLQSADDHTRTLVAADARTPSLLSYVPKRNIYTRADDWKYSADTEPVGVRLTALDGRTATVLFSWSTYMIEPRLFVTYHDGLLPEDVPRLLQVLDVIGHEAGKKEGWIWGLPVGSDLTEAWLRQEGRVVREGLRGEVRGHLLAMAWYGGGERGRYLDTGMWTWC